MTIPIAIVGRGCVLPGAATPQELWQCIQQGKDVLSRPPADAWPINSDLVTVDEAGFRWSDRGGYIRNFRFDPRGFAVDPDNLLQADRSAHWVLHASRAALHEAGHSVERPHPRVGAVLGHLSLPLPAQARYATSVWISRWAATQGLADLAKSVTDTAPAAFNRYMSSLPTRLLARALGLGARAFTLDAACASSLYALKLACDALEDGSADMMLSGAVCGTDPMFLHFGFRALKALSPTGQSRPFHCQADGLVPSEGCVILALKRLEDAEAAGDRIYGVIRGIGLSNDGGATGLLVPSSAGQVRAMRAALTNAALAPSDVGLLECHATGTPVGDATELSSIAQVYGVSERLPIGSLKAQIGHLLAAAGSAGILKVLGAFEHRVIPRTMQVDAPIAALGEAPVRLPRETEPWTGTPRRIAAVSSFGFGGNNAHVLLQEHEFGRKGPLFQIPIRVAPSRLAVIGLGVIAAGASNRAEFESALLEGRPMLNDSGMLGSCGIADAFELKPSEIHFPPADLNDSLPQQVALLKAASEALAGVRVLPHARTGVLTGMEGDPELARKLARSLAATWANRWSDQYGTSLDATWKDQFSNAFASPLRASGVTGALLNIVANRVNAQFKLSAFGYSISADEASGIRALEVAARALQRGEVDAAVVGAADLNCEEVSACASSVLAGVGRQILGDAAVVIVLKRLSDAQRDTEDILAVLETGPDSPEDGLATQTLGDAPGALQLAETLGHAHAASGLLHVAAGVIACQRGARLSLGPAIPWLSPATERRVQVTIKAQGNQTGEVLLRAPSDGRRAPVKLHSSHPLRIWHFAATDRAGLRAALRSGSLGQQGSMRIAFVAGTGAQFEQQRDLALETLETDGDRPRSADIAFRTSPIAGKLAAVYTAAGTAYKDMGRTLLLACPDLVERAMERLGSLKDTCDWIYRQPARRVTPLEQLAGSSLLSQVHALLTADVLGVAPQAAVGLSSGETNALLGLGAWTDAEGLFEGLSPLYANELGGRFDLLRRAWRNPAANWAGWLVTLPPDQVRDAIRDEHHAYLTMIYGPNTCAIGGERAAMDRVVARLGRANATPVQHELAVHCPELLSVRDTWHSLHLRSTRKIPEVRFYTAAQCGSYYADAGQIADALLEMASGPVDFPSMVESAWSDGVRVFVEHGPRSLCSQLIAQILRGRDHVVVSFDEFPNDAVRGVLHAAGRLWAAGVPVNIDAVNARLGSPVAPSGKRGIRFSAHPPPLLLPDWPRSSPALKGHPPVEVPSNPEPRAKMNAMVNSPVRHHSEVASPPAPLWSRTDLERMSSGRLADFFGPLFEAQEHYARQVRMPMPPLLLADRVMSINAEPGSMGLGRITTETDVTANAWYLHDGGMPAGLEVEAGQADLLLISYLGADLHNRGERVYRLLGCEMTFHGERRPQVGDTLRYEIEVTGHARSGDVRLFFFRYDSYLNGQLRLSVRNGRAGFFTNQELADAGGVIWDPARDGPDESIRHAISDRFHKPRAFNEKQVRAFTEGRAFDCFGAGFELAATHHRSPRSQAGEMRLFNQVETLDPLGGPWGRGYLRATYRIRGDEWFFPGHFHNDPTMPGTLMCEAGVQLMSFYLAGMGHSLTRDGWTFELVPSGTFKATCRGQVIPTSREMTYEILVRGLEISEYPTLWADVLLTVDGRKAFHGRNLGVRLLPGLPGTEFPNLQQAPGASPPAQVDGFLFDQQSLFNCATGRVSQAFGPRFARFDGARTLPRLPSPPYHFMSRVVRCEGPPEAMLAGTSIEVEYDIPQQAWFFEDNDGVTMPFAILLEAALQPCGWLTAYMGVPLHCEKDLRFRNLDGKGTLLRAVRWGDGILRTAVRCTSIARSGDTFIESFDVKCSVGGAAAFTLETTFGHFTTDALNQQVGLPVNQSEQACVAPTSLERAVDLHAEGDSAQLPRLAHGQLLMLDRVTGYWPQGGTAGRGRLQAEFDVDPKAWFFKAHFYRDPVQPGSLGIEAMIQLLQYHMRARGLAAGLRTPRFEPVAVGRPLAWKYRGQVLPTNRKVSVEMEIADEGRDPGGPWVSAHAWLWVDGLRIYQARNLTMRLVDEGGAA